MTVWICEQWKGKGNPTEFQGVFDTEYKAVAACVSDDYFIFPAEMNVEIAKETLPPIGYYPQLETKEHIRLAKPPPN
jgi:hypothetical protein